VPRSVVYHKHDGSFGKVSSPRKQLLWNRNVLFLLFKNCEEASLRRILPLAILLTLERATYFLHQETDEERSAVQTMFASIVDDERREQEIRDVGIAHLRAVGEFVASLPGLREKRERIQSARSLDDAELRSRFPQELTFEDQVNGLVHPSWHDRLLPLFELDGLLGKTSIEGHLFSRLEKLEDSVLDYRRTVDTLGEELVRKTRDQDEKAAHLDRMAAHITDLERDRAELFRLRSKAWFKAIQRLGRLLGR
jgi:hypothetical protein